MAFSKRMRVWTIALGVACLPCLTVFGFQCSVANRAEEGIKRELAAIRALGVVTTPESMPVPGDPALNAALSYSDAIAMRKELKLELPARETDPKKVASFEAAVSKFLPAMKLVRQGSALPECKFVRKWELGPNLPFSELAELKTFAKVACSLSEIEARSGNFTESFAWLQAVRKLSIHSQEPHLIGQLVGLALEGILLKSLQTQIVAHGKNSDFRRSATSFLNRKVKLPNVRDGMSGEIIMVTQTFRMLESGEIKSIESLSAPIDEPEKSDSGSPFNYLFRVRAIRNQVQYLVLQRYRLALQDMGSNGQHYERIASATKAMHERSRNPDGLVETLAGIFDFGASTTADASIQLLARLNLTRQGLELYAIRAKTGAFPKSLDSKTRWSRDPFSRQTLIYRREGDTFKLYSVGRDRKDDGGKLTTEGRKLDVIFGPS